MTVVSEGEREREGEREKGKNGKWRWANRAPKAAAATAVFAVVVCAKGPIRNADRFSSAALRHNSSTQSMASQMTEWMDGWSDGRTDAQHLFSAAQAAPLSAN